MNLRLRTAVLPLLLVPALCLTSPAYADTTGQGTVSATQVTIGSTVLFSGSGFAPGTEVICYGGLDGQRELARVTADADGRFQLNARTQVVGDVRYRAVGQDATSGTRTLTATVEVTVGSGSGARTIDAGTGGLADTTPDPVPAVALGLTGLVLAGVAVRRSRATSGG